MGPVRFVKLSHAESRMPIILQVGQIYSVMNKDGKTIVRTLQGSEFHVWEKVADVFDLLEQKEAVLWKETGN